MFSPYNHDESELMFLDSFNNQTLFDLMNYLSQSNYIHMVKVEDMQYSVHAHSFAIVTVTRICGAHV